jgi:hypothetical protein
MFQKYLLTYGTYDVGDMITMTRYSKSLEEALEDAQCIARNHFEALVRGKRIRWKHSIGEFVEEYRDKVKYLTGKRPVGPEYKGQSFWNLGYNKYSDMLEDHIWYQAELIDIKNPFEEL